MDKRSHRFSFTNTDITQIGTYQRATKKHPSRYENYHMRFKAEIEKLIVEYDSARDFSVFFLRDPNIADFFKNRQDAVCDLLINLGDGTLSVNQKGSSEAESLCHAIKVISKSIGEKETRSMLRKIANVVSLCAESNGILETAKYPIQSEEKTSKSFEEITYDKLLQKRRDIAQLYADKCKLAESGRACSFFSLQNTAPAIHLTAPAGGYPCIILEMYDYFENSRASIPSKLKEHFPQSSKNYSRNKQQQKQKNDFSTPFQQHMPSIVVMRITRLLSAYLAGLMNQIARNKMGKDWIWADYQQSFGSLRPTLTDTGFSVRFSPGLVPDQYYAIFETAVAKLEAELQQQSTKDVLQRLLMIGGGWSDEAKGKDEYRGVINFNNIFMNGRQAECYLDKLVLDVSNSNQINGEMSLAAIINQTCPPFEDTSEERNTRVSRLEDGVGENMALRSEPFSDLFLEAWLEKIFNLFDKKYADLNNDPLVFTEELNRIKGAFNELKARIPRVLSWNEAIYSIEQGMSLLTLLYELSETVNCMQEPDNSKSEVGKNSIVTQGTVVTSNPLAANKACFTASTLNGMQSFDLSLTILDGLAEALNLGELNPFTVKRGEIYFEYSNTLSKKKSAFKEVAAGLPDVLITDLSPFPQSSPGDTQEAAIEHFLPRNSLPVIAIVDITSASTQQIKQMMQLLNDPLTPLQAIITNASDNKYGQAGVDTRSRGEVRLITKRGFDKDSKFEIAGNTILLKDFTEDLERIFKEHQTHFNNFNQARDRMYDDLGLRRSIDPKPQLKRHFSGSTVYSARTFFSHTEENRGEESKGHDAPASNLPIK